MPRCHSTCALECDGLFYDLHHLCKGDEINEKLKARCDGRTRMYDAGNVIRMNDDMILTQHAIGGLKKQRSYWLVSVRVRGSRMYETCRK